MSQITRCPSCTTTFKVVPDQLRISEGWVRCGQCKTVFDASEHLVTLGAAPAPLADPQQADAAGSAVIKKSALNQSVPPSNDLPAKGVWSQSASAAAKVGRVEPPKQQALAKDGQTDVVIPAFLLSPEANDQQVDVTPAAEQLSPAHTARHKTIGPFSWSKPVRPSDTIATVSASKAAVQEPPLGIVSAPAPLSVSVKMPETGLQEPRPSIDSVVVPSAQVLSPLASRKASPFFADSVKTTSRDTNAILSTPPLSDVPFPTLHSSDDEGGSKVLANAQTNAAGTKQTQIPSAPHPQTREVHASLTEMVPADTAVVVESDTEDSETQTADLSSQVSLPPLVFPENTPEIKTHSGMSLPYLARGDQASHARAESDDALPTEEASFVLAARRREFWRKPWVRGMLFAAFLLFALLLALQIGMRYRNELAAQTPQARALLLKVCPLLRCELAPVQHIDDLVIDSSAFNKARGEGYLLGLTIKNRAAINLAMPAVELTLTDNQDQPVVRRVLYPHDMGAPVEIGALGEWNATLPVAVSASSNRIAGYRLAIFYP